MPQNWKQGSRAEIWKTCRAILAGCSPTSDKLSPFQPLSGGSHAPPACEVDLHEYFQEELSPILLKLCHFSAVTELIIFNFPFSKQRHSFSKLRQTLFPPCSHNQAAHNTNSSATHSFGYMLLFILSIIISMDQSNRVEKSVSIQNIKKSPFNVF